MIAPEPQTPSPAALWGLAACITITMSQLLLNWHRGACDWLDAADLLIVCLAFAFWDRHRTPGHFAVMGVALYWLAVR
jgi:hypothetical protein